MATQVTFVIFLIKRATPGRTYESHTIVRSLFNALPFEVEVSEPEPRTDYRAACKCKEVYRITEDSIRDLSRKGLIRQELRGAKPACICRCMGILSS